MPIGRPCLRRRCPKLAVSGSYCPDHSRKTEEPWRDLYSRREWQRTVEAMLNEAGHRCERCRATRRLQVHHRVKLERLWRMAENFREFVALACDRRHLEVLCPACHAKQERKA